MDTEEKFRNWTNGGGIMLVNGWRRDTDAKGRSFPGVTWRHAARASPYLKRNKRRRNGRLPVSSLKSLDALPRSLE